MTLRSVSVCCLSLFAGLLLFSSRAAASECTAVVYAFRHAEDVKEKVPEHPCLPDSLVKCTTELTKVGMEHADLYLEMIENLQHEENFCPLGAVYAVNPILPNGSGGTTNPYFTGKPLANELFDINPYIQVLGIGIDEHLKAFDKESLRSALFSVLNIPQSVAFFWTSEGLHDLGVFLGTQNIPEKSPGSPPRNAAYILKYDGSSGFLPLENAQQYIQCFNYAQSGEPKNNFTNLYYCGNLDNGDLKVPAGFDQWEKLHARICNRDAPGFTRISSPPPTGYYGYCESPPAGAAP